MDGIAPANAAQPAPNGNANDQVQQPNVADGTAKGWILEVKERDHDNGVQDGTIRDVVKECRRRLVGQGVTIINSVRTAGFSFYVPVAQRDPTFDPYEAALTRDHAVRITVSPMRPDKRRGPAGERQVKSKKIRFGNGN